MSEPSQDDQQLLDQLQRETFEYFLNEVSEANGLIADKTRAGWPASIAATGLGLTAYPVAVERALMTRDEAIRATLTPLRFLKRSVQSVDPDATGFRGFYYHFLDMETGQRAWNSELSTIDTALLLAGALAAASYFDREVKEEEEIRRIADDLYRRADWKWALNGGATITHGWTPEHGFLPYRWEGYDEALLLYLMALGSPTSPVGDESYSAWLSTYAWKSIYGREFIYAGPLFIHQLSHIWVDFRGIQDAYTRDRQTDYFENSRRATYVQQQYAIRNPREYESYGKDCWGITASDGPGPATLKVDGIERVFFDYMARGAPHGPDDGTLAPWAVVASLPFAPEIVLPTVRHFVHDIKLRQTDAYGFKATFNPTYPGKRTHPFGWVSAWNYGLNQGPIVLMIENHRTGLVWQLMRRSPYIVTALRRAGFTGGWLKNA